MIINKFFVYTLVCFFGLSLQVVKAAEETIRIYPTDDGANVLYDDDGQVEWSAARSYGGILSQPTIMDSEALGVRSDDQSGYFRIYRSSILFDTSNIPIDAIIQSASINLFKFPTANNHNDTKVVVTEHIRDNIATLSPVDWSLSHYGIEFTRELLVDSQYTPFLLNVAGLNYINKQSYTVFGMLSEFDFDDIAPTASPSAAAFYSSEVAGTSVDPYLEITYTVPDVQKSIAELIIDFKTIVNTQIVLKSNKSVYVAQIKVLEQAIEKQKNAIALEHIKVLERQITHDEKTGVVSSVTAEEMRMLLMEIKDALITG